MSVWLRAVREADGSDLLLVSGAPPTMRATGRLTGLTQTPLEPEDVEAAALPFVPRRLETRYREGEAIDLAFALPGLGRFRMNFHRERGRPAAAIRALPLRIPRISDLHFTHDVDRLARLPRGLVLIGGPTGSGKTTTLAAFVADINNRDTRHIITVEDPIEYEHPHGRSIVEQIEIGIDVADFPTALRSAVRQAPDVIVVGEMRDPETMRIALTAAGRRFQERSAVPRWPRPSCKGTHDAQTQAVDVFRIDPRLQATAVISYREPYQPGWGAVEREGDRAGALVAEAVLERIADQLVGHDDGYRLFRPPFESRVHLGPARNTNRTMHTDQVGNQFRQYRVQINGLAACAVEALVHVGKQIDPGPRVLEGRFATGSAIRRE